MGKEEWSRLGRGEEERSRLGRGRSWIRWGRKKEMDEVEREFEVEWRRGVLSGIERKTIVLVYYLIMYRYAG